MTGDGYNSINLYVGTLGWDLRNCNTRWTLAIVVRAILV